MKSRRTPSQKRVLKLLHASTRALSAQEIFSKLRKQQLATGLATVYRALDALKLSGEVHVRMQTNGESLYTAAHDDTHHLTCLNCGKSVTIAECPVHALEAQLQASHQFQVFYHNLEFFGLCDRCQS
ncbi:Fe2+/Zn2+ uptake regulation protein [Rubidibacter lacunae KORDI 51-2]|uniref:Fe2+/Zn2+ uptake regulation protein n=1 Tax=Rubidibacter lacunae KORDI 51-2 TaxID=582515 RepID=U5DF15_9CHRO|nr:transcriptional repressor [Rubidibacter lacunae]ERN40196.1 Fe2+/Zn2+ uptake regulation protein [Rubidibacter lacunae KORDI 51-2]